MTIFDWLWSIRHRKLIWETRALIRLQYLLQNELGLKESFSAKELKVLLGAIRQPKRA